VLLAAGQYVRGMLALGAGQYGDAFDHLTRLAEQDAPVHYHLIRCFAIGDYAEAAAHCGHRDQAVAALRLLEPFAERTPSPCLRVAIAYARAVLADDEDGFTSALGSGGALGSVGALGHKDMARWPFFRARLQLGFGAWLRRQRRPAESRGPLRAARDTFDALGAAPWATRARQELRAAGESGRHRLPHAFDQLTPQELQITQMAAEGLSNREIGQRLYLSHRTIESHLHRVYPKLGITSRTQLAKVLTDTPA
jgi:ATP/maltotriose-dependent transcriptional regulator MalT